MTTPSRPEERPPEIIIVRRGGDDEEEGHHGGVWKIAFADFMTAMMCFFLVMWLINAANEQTRAALASYFNPVKLVDHSTNRKGLGEVGQGPESATEQEDAEKSTDAPAGERDKTTGPASFHNSADLADRRKYSDENFFSNPYAVLAEISADIGREQNISTKGEGGQQLSGPSSGASGGEAYRDPFAPDFWSQQVEVPQVGVEGDPDQAREQPAGADAEAAQTGKFERTAASPAEAEAEAAANAGAVSAAATPPDGPAQVTAVPVERVPEVEPLAPPPEQKKPAGTSSEEAGEAVEPVQEAAEPAPQVQEDASTPAPAAAEAHMKAAEAREKAAGELRTALTEALKGEGLATSVTVTAAEGGVLISITDDIPNGMFAVGSAVPERPLVLAMEKIGRTLATHPGNIRVHGHTDGRPFKGGDYDNWRLSTARAHAAQYMLVRGGVDESRIAEVAGFADRKLKVPDDPLADANRRIEILLEVPQ